MMIAGITGGMGCGKSTVGLGFEARGFRRLDSDRIVREQVLTAPAVMAELAADFGPGILETDPAGGQRVCRPRLAELVFADDAARLRLEALTHPRVLQVWREAFAAAPSGRWVVEVPLLFEKALENWFDFTVCVACSPEQQLARLEQRGLSRMLAGRRISKQLPLARKIERSDFVLWNDGSAVFLGQQIDRLADALPVA